jgi:hypothetical protein
VVPSVLVGARGRADLLAPLLSSLEQHHRVRFFLVVLVRAASCPLATGDGHWPLATATVQSVGVAVLLPPLGLRGPFLALGRETKRAGSPFFPARSAQTKSGRGPVVLAGRPSGNEKNWFFLFSFVI